MPKYKVTLVFDGEYECMVEAENKEDAFERALDVCYYDRHYSPFDEVYYDDSLIEEFDEEEED